MMHQRGFALLLAMLFALSISALIVLYQRMAWDIARLQQQETAQGALRIAAQKKLLHIIRQGKPNTQGSITQRLAQWPCARLQNSAVEHIALSVYKTQIPLGHGKTRCLSAIWLAPDATPPQVVCETEQVHNVSGRLRSLHEQECL